MELNLKAERNRVDGSIYELKQWKKNRDKKTLQRAHESGQKRPLTSGALETAVELLEHYKIVLSKIKT